MEKFQIGEQANAAAEVEALLYHNGFSYRREENRFHLVLTDRGCKWETVFLCLKQQVLLCSRFPFPVQNQEMALALCQEVNRQVLFGSLFLLEDRLVFRTGADLFDAYSAYEHLGRALEYNGGVMTRFWTDMALCTQPTTEDLGVKTNSKL